LNTGPSRLSISLHSLLMLSCLFHSPSFFNRANLSTILRAADKHRFPPPLKVPATTRDLSIRTVPGLSQYHSAVWVIFSRMLFRSMLQSAPRDDTRLCGRADHMCDAMSCQSVLPSPKAHRLSKCEVRVEIGCEGWRKGWRPWPAQTRPSRLQVV